MPDRLRSSWLEIGLRSIESENRVRAAWQRDIINRVMSSKPSLLQDPAVRLALRQSPPLFIPAIPFGFLLGAAMTTSEMPTWIAWLSNITIFGGAAQLALVTSAGVASWWTAVATAIVINSRHIMYSAAVTPRYQNQPRWFRWIGPYMLIDQVFALVSVRDELDTEGFRRYSMTCGLFFGTSWTAVTTLGVALGARVPTDWRLEMAIAIMFAGLVVMPLAKLSSAVAAVVGGGATLLLLGLPNRLGLLAGAGVGMVAAYLTDEWVDSRKPAVPIGAEDGQAAS